MPANFGNTERDNVGIPTSSVFVPGTSNGDLTTLQGGPSSTDGNGYKSAPAAMYITNPATLGQQLSSASYPMVPASDYTFPTQPQYTSLVGNGPSVVNGANTDLFSWIDVRPYKWCTLSISGTYSGTLTFQMSPDQSLVQSQQLGNTTSWTSSAGFVTSTSSTNVIYTGPLISRYFRVRMTSFTSNASLAATLDLYTQPPFIFPAQLYTAIQAVANPSGTTNFHLVSAGSNNATNLKSSQGQVYGYDIYNSAAYTIYLKFFNKSSTPAPGTDTPVRTVGVPAGAHSVKDIPAGWTFSSGIGICIVKGIADSDNTAVAASDCVVDIDKV